VAGSGLAYGYSGVRILRRTDTQAYDFEDYLPPADHGNVLITTQLFRLQQPKASLRLGAVDNDIGREILESRVGKELSGMCI
jgi:hypothetical protein